MVRRLRVRVFTYARSGSAGDKMGPETSVAAIALSVSATLDVAMGVVACLVWLTTHGLFFRSCHADRPCPYG